MFDIYSKLCDITNENLKKHNPEACMHFEQVEGLDYSIFNYPQSILMGIKDTDTFIRECFYKILDRSVDEHNFNAYSYALKKKKLTREAFIEELLSSNEWKLKKTGFKK